MHAKVIIFAVFCISAAMAYPTEQYTGKELFLADEEQFLSEVPLQRAKRQFNLQGGGSPRQGFDLSANARFPIWQSQNQRNSLHGTAGYAQHLGGPWGNSKPIYSGGLQFTHRF